MMISCLKTLRLVALASICVPAAAFAATPPVFPVLTYEPYAVTSPLAMAEGDLNGDGITDTLYASASTAAGSTTLTAALRSANPGAAPTLATSTTIASTANSILLVDLNNDKKLDAVVTCIDSNNIGTVAILTGNGDGTFTAVGAIPYYGRKVLAADLNGDGFNDLVIQAAPFANQPNQYVVVLNKGTSIPTFASPVTYSSYPTTPAGNDQILIADINMDGKPDALLGADDHDFGAWAAYVLSGDGNGNFTTRVNLGAGTLAVADFDGDGKPDMASYAVGINSGSGYILIEFPNSGKNAVKTLVSSGTANVLPLDVNGDGKLDIVLAGHTATILFGDGTGAFTVGKSYAAPGTFYTARKGALGMDLVYATPAGFYTLHNDGKGVFDGLPSIYFTDSPVVGDFNGDGLTDLAGAESAGGVYSIFGHGDGTFTFPTGTPVLPYGSLPVRADFNGDGIPDVVYVNQADTESPAFSCCSGSMLRSAKGNADHTFTSVPNYGNIGSASPVSSYSYPRGIVAGDFNGDGKMDVAISYNDTVLQHRSALVIIQGNGDGTFAWDGSYWAISTTVVQGPAGIDSRPFAADLNGDGKLDLIWGANAYINQGNNNFTALPLPATGTPLLLADLNGDKFADIVIDNAVYAGKGDGTFLPTPIATIATPTGASFVTANTGDIDGDGNPDLVIQSMASLATFTVAYGDGKGNFTTDPNVYTTGSVRPVTATFARLNNSALPLNSGKRLDYVVFTSGAAVPMFNRNNPSPVTTRGLTANLTLAPGFSPMRPLAPASFTAIVTSSGTPIPTGTVTFTGQDGKALGTVDIAYSTAKIQTPFPSEGTYSVSATYSGDSNYAPTGPVSTSIIIARQPTVMSLLLLGSYLAQRPAQLKAHVYGYNPTALVTFYANGNAIGTAPVQTEFATLNYNFPTVGTYSITASYPGDASNLPATADAVTITTNPPPDFTISASPDTVTVNAGDKASWPVTITSINNFSGYVTMGCQADSCGTTQVYVSPTVPGTVTYSVQTTKPSAVRPSVRITPVAAAALLLFATGRRRRLRLAPQMRIGLFVLCAFLGTTMFSGCSSGTSSSSSGSSSGTTGNPPKTYSLVITGADIPNGVLHTCTLTLIVK
ncbi:MAG: VCBS repeat-containing protein [Acidobacteria bacterium]|nr:VCBS repeat-containing protein [Acidobacteriota bacterium]